MYIFFVFVNNIFSKVNNSCSKKVIRLNIFSLIIFEQRYILVFIRSIYVGDKFILFAEKLKFLGSNVGNIYKIRLFLYFLMVFISPVLG